MRVSQVKAIATVIFRIAVGLLFISSGYSKIIPPIEYFEISVRLYDVFPELIIPLVIWFVPIVEIFLGSMLIIGLECKKISLAFAGLIFCFVLILAQALLRKLNIDDCGCFGDTWFHLSLYQTFALDTVLFVLMSRFGQLKEYPYSVDQFLEKRIVQQ